MTQENTTNPPAGQPLPDDEKTDRSREMRVIAELTLLQNQLDLSDAKFCKKHTAFEASTWSKLKSGTYEAQDWGPAMVKVRAALEGVRTHMEQRAGAQQLVRFSFIEELITGVKTARKQQRDRLVVLLAPTGGGKSCAEQFLRAEPDFGATLASVEARESHRDSLLGFIRALAVTLGIEKPALVTHLAEEEVLSELRRTPRVLMIDEAHHLGQRPLNFIKLLLNQTRCTIVMRAIPELWDRLEKKAYAEAAQLTTRTAAVIRVKGISLEDARLFCAARVNGWDEIIPETRVEIAKILSRHAPKLGMWDGAALFVTFLMDAAVGALPTVAHAMKAVENLEALR